MRLKSNFIDTSLRVLDITLYIDDCIAYSNGQFDIVPL
jgi:hypothetical protein